MKHYMHPEISTTNIIYSLKNLTTPTIPAAHKILPFLNNHYTLEMSRARM